MRKLELWHGGRNGEAQVQGSDERVEKSRSGGTSDGCSNRSNCEERNPRARGKGAKTNKGCNVLRETDMAGLHLFCILIHPFPLSFLIHCLCALSRSQFPTLILILFSFECWAQYQPDSQKQIKLFSSQIHSETSLL